MKTFFSKLLPMTLVLGLVFSLCSVLVPIQFFADDSVTYTFDFTSDFSGWTNHLTIVDTVSNVTVIDVSTSNRYVDFTIPLNDHVYSFYMYKSSGSNFRYADIVRFYMPDEVNYVALSSDPSNPAIFSTLTPYRFYTYNYGSSKLLYFRLADSLVPSTPTPEPTPTPTPEPSATPSIFDAFQPFRSFSGTYYNREALYFPDSVTSNRYQQYSGIVSNHDAMITDIRTNIDYYSDSIVYKFEYDLDYLTDGTTYDFSFLYDADQAFGYVYAYYTVNGIKYDIPVNQNTLTGTYTVCGCAPYPSSTGQLTPTLWEFNYNLSNQRAINLGSIFTVGNKITLTVIVSVDEFPYLPSGFDWSTFFQDTRPDNVFLYTLGGLAALPFFISGLSFLALGALIGIILKFMR